MLMTSSGGARVLALPSRGAVRLLSPMSSSLLRHGHQIRTFRLGWGWWFPRLISERHRDLRRRHRFLRLKCSEAWRNKHPRDRIFGRRWFLESTDIHAASIRNHWNNRYDSKRTVVPENLDGVRPGQHIEDVERGAMEHLLFGENWKPFRNDKHDFQPEKFNLESWIEDQLFKKPDAASSSPPERTPVEAEIPYTIDPITNRKVFRTPPEQSNQQIREPDADGVIPVKSFKKYRAQFAQRTTDPAALDGMQEVSHTPIDQAELPNTPKTLMRDDAETASQPKNEILDPDMPPSQSELSHYARVDLETGEESSKHARHLRSVSDAMSDINHSYNRHQNSIRRERASREPKEEVTAKSSESARQSSISQPGTSALVDVYMPPSDNELEKYKEIPADVTHDNTLDPGGRYSFQKQAAFWETEETSPWEAAPWEGSQANATFLEDEVSRYKEIRYNEPDGKSPGFTVAEIPEDTHRYKPLRYNEPDGMPSTSTDSNFDPAELKKYRRPVRWQEPDGRPPTLQGPEDSEAELQKYKPMRYQEPDGKPSEVDKANTFSLSSADDIELSKYRAVKLTERSEPDAARSDNIAASLKDYDNSPSNAWVHGSVKSAESSNDFLEKIRKLRMLTSDDTNQKAATAISERNSGVQTERRISQYRPLLESLMTRLQTASDAADQEAMSAVKSVKQRFQSAIDMSSRVETPRSGLTGNYARDFPEEFATTWAQAESGLRPKFNESQLLETKMDAQASTTPSADARPLNESRIEPSLDRNKTSQANKITPGVAKAGIDPYSKVPQGLETSYKEECGGISTWPTYVKNYHNTKSATESTVSILTDNATPSQDLPVAEVSTEPIVYKILAYDPTMQSINFAETTSVVPETASPLTPAEVMLRLSNPAKFFPHFAPLRAQGFEIVSGSGDVLVFRKVRDADVSAAGSRPKEPEAVTTAPPTNSAVNPIDMTGTSRYIAPAAADFASPTGYINYDTPSSANLPPPPTAKPRFRSGITVKREEDKFSGPKEASKEPRPKSVGKRMLVGAAWVGGVSYAIGVVGEYFKTGGVDGKGPKGLGGAKELREARRREW
jgi:hypothetical protein